MASREEKPDDLPLSAEEIAALPRWAAVALAARCAFRIAPGLQTALHMSPQALRNGFLLLDICQTVSALSSIQGKPYMASVVRTAYENLRDFRRILAEENLTLEYCVVDTTFNTLVAASDFSEPPRASADSLARAVNSYFKAGAFVDVGFVSDALAKAVRADYEDLVRMNLGGAGIDGRLVPRTFFSLPLWGDAGTVPRDWQKKLDGWEKALKTFNLLHIHYRYMQMCRGGDIDWEEPEQRVQAWAKENAKKITAGTAKKQTKQPRESQPKPKMPLPAEEPAATIPPTPQPAPTPRPPDLRMLSDEALKDDTGDRLDFKPYANALAGLINNPKTKTPLTLAINAPWGAGKTTLARMIQRRLEGKPAAGGKRPHVTCWFNAWMHDDAPNLASAFAAEIASAANQMRPLWRQLLQPLPSAMLQTSDRFKRRMALIFLLLIVAFFFSRWLGPLIPVAKDSKDLLDQIFLALGPQKSVFAVMVGILALLAKLLSVMAPLAKSVAGFIIDPKDAAATASMKQVSEQLGNLIKQSTPPGSRFVIFVDDIERCQAPRSVDVLEVVNQLLGHEGVVTVLMADMPAVAACAQIKYEKLAQIYTPSGAPETNGRGKAYGRAYLQKIIQLQFDLPPYESAKIHGLIRTLAKEAPEPSATAEPSGLLPAKNWRVRLNEYLRPIVTGEAWDQFSQRLDRWLAMLLQFLTDRNVSLRELVPLVPATADWQQGFAFRGELRQLRTQSPRLLSLVRIIPWLLLAPPRWLVSRVDQWAYLRTQGWPAFWRGKSWYIFSWGLDVFCFFYLSALVGTFVTVPAIADFFGYPAFLGRLFPELAGSRLGQWMIFDLHFSLLILAIIPIGATAWLRSHIQQRRDSTIRPAVSPPNFKKAREQQTRLESIPGRSSAGPRRKC